MDNKHIGEIIKEYRKGAKLTQKQLAQKIKKAESTVRMWEIGKNTPPLDTLKEVGEVLNIPLGTLLLKAGYIDEFKEMVKENMEKPPTIPTLGQALRESRAELEMSLEEISIQANLDKSLLERLENGESVELTEQQLLDLAKAYDYTFAYLYLLTGKGNKLFDQNTLNNLLIRLRPLPASYMESTVSITFEEFYEEEKKLQGGTEVKVDIAKTIYDEFIFANEIDQLMKLHAIPNLWRNSPDIQYLLTLSDIKLNYKGRTLSSKDKKRIFEKIEEIKEEFEYQD